MLVCENCGSNKVQVKCWVDVNTGEVYDGCGFGDSSDNWCTVCNEHTKLNIIEQDLSIKVGDVVETIGVYNTLCKKEFYEVRSINENKIELLDDSGYCRWYLSKNFKKIR